ncbi:MAG: AzlC family ABC transporter permease [Acidimicrobiia bacterium]|nr:AzlC family ABC transporter permease [Acidimicrobiia bacterium]
MPRLDPIVRRAIRDSLPIFIPAIPFALVLGVAITESALPPAVGWSSNFLIFAGAAQLATVTLAATATWVTLVTTAAVINLRHVMYSTALAPRFGPQPRWFRWVGPYVLIDQVFALVSQRDDLDDDTWRRYFLACGFSFFIGWNITVTLGMLVGSEIPQSWRLGVAPAVMFVGMVVIGITNRPGIVAAIVGAGVTYLCLELPHNTGLLVGALAGVAAAFVAETMSVQRAVDEDPDEDPRLSVR